MSEDREALDLAADWADISQGLRKDLGHQLHSQWIKPIQLGTFCKETGTLDLFLPTDFSANWVADRFADRLSLAWKIARSEVRNVRISVHPGRRQLSDVSLTGHDGFGRGAANDGADPSGMLHAAGTIGEQGFTSSVGLDPSLTFAAFVTGTTNVLAFNAAERMAKIEKPQFSPLYLKAATGQGKTHLLHAIGHAYLGTHPRARIFYCSAERFMVEFVQALRQNEMIEFKIAAAGLRPAAGRRHPVHHRQGQRAGRTALHDRRAAGRRQAAGVRRRPRAAGARRGRTAAAVSPFDGAGRRHRSPPISNCAARSWNPSSPASPRSKCRAT